MWARHKPDTRSRTVVGSQSMMSISIRYIHIRTIFAHSPQTRTKRKLSRSGGSGHNPGFWSRRIIIAGLIHTIGLKNMNWCLVVKCTMNNLDRAANIAPSLVSMWYVQQNSSKLRVSKNNSFFFDVCFRFGLRNRLWPTCKLLWRIRQEILRGITFLARMFQSRSTLQCENLEKPTSKYIYEANIQCLGMGTRRAFCT